MAAYDSTNIQLPADLFALTAHPSAPLLTAALSSGHVYTYTWPRSSSSSTSDGDDDDDEATTFSPSKPAPSIVWKTRRHKGSCRSAVFSADGGVLYTTGTDGLLKAATSETGRVVSKAVLPNPSSDAPTTLLPLSPMHLLLGTDAGNVHLYDLRTQADFAGAAPAASWKAVHEDYISALLALPATAASTTGYSRQFVVSGDTSLSHLDARRPGKVLSRSEPQEDEILNMIYVANAPSKNTGGSEKVVTGTASGVVTTWNKGFWEDHQERIPLSRATSDSIDSLLALPVGYQVEGVGYGTFFAAGSGDGKVRIVKMGGNKTVATMAHSGLEEGVSALALDCEGRIVSGGGTVIKIWSPREEEEQQAEAEEEESKKRGKESDSDDDGSDRDEVDSEDSDDERERKKRKKKKRKGGKGKAKSAGVKNVNSFEGLD
ncbi:WD40-repeat-containing domain protein [Sphaerosporella brunnea]|uniref:WD repeat-containing protein JIP5 n=1 Tax=Sphaerosporella brunnea TaxID=1250544 RepID=A0A5J5ES69_9PEZI|nr:WD40-repeat-containing domain protein [Sphaerosporella brunnea]